ncbi:MAG TPA: flagellar assembly protein A, partial [Spirochaetia bacterium]|nr:flagellar assembly protein A [Spirochaetia bacterium]
MAVKGNLNLEIDEPGVEVHITLTPDENGTDLTVDGIRTLLAEKNIRQGVDLDAIDRAMRSLARGRKEPVSFLAAAGVRPEPPSPETIAFESCPIPERLAATARAVLARARPARGYRLREERTRQEKKVVKRGRLPFLPAREEVEVEVQKTTIREEVPIDPAVVETGWVSQGTLVARFRPGSAGKAGKSVFGRVVAAPRLDLAGFLVLDGLTRSGVEVRADVPGFLRRGSTWCDVVPFRDHVVRVAASRDGLTCLLSFAPGDAEAPAPDPKDILSRAAELGFPDSSLIPAHEVETLLQDAVLRGAELKSVSLTPRVNGAAVVAISGDRLKATLSLRKGRGGGTALTTAAVSEAIRASKVRGFNPAEVRAHLLEFFAGRQTELVDYALASGREPKAGAQPRV